LDDGKGTPVAAADVTLAAARIDIMDGSSSGSSISSSSGSVPLPPDLKLLVGVMSYQAPVALGRRAAMRSLVQPAVGCALRFVMSSSTPDEDHALPDVLKFNVNESGRILGTYLLNNAFFRFAVALNPRVPFIARADDDSFFDMSTVLAEMLAASSCVAAPHPVFDYAVKGLGEHAGQVGNTAWSPPWAQEFTHKPAVQPTATEAAQCSPGSRALIYGDFKEWYMWSPRSMQATCFDFSYGRHALAMDRLRDMGGNLSRLPRFQRECLHADLAGP